MSYNEVLKKAGYSKEFIDAFKAYTEENVTYKNDFQEDEIGNINLNTFYVETDSRDKTDKFYLS